MDKGRGPVATVLVQTGTLKVGDIVVVGDTYGRVRALENSRGERITKAGPSPPGGGPGPGRGAGGGRHPARRRRREDRPQHDRGAARRRGPRDRLAAPRWRTCTARSRPARPRSCAIILKADVQGSLGAIRHALEQVQTDEVRINILHEGTGDITDNDINLASASNAIVVGFNTKLDPQARRTAEAEGVDVRLYDIIYQPHRRDERRAERPARARGGRGRRGPRRGAPDLPQSAATSSAAAT